jgi:dTDP-4-amino-4,6-dideoxygalactose transaminase
MLFARGDALRRYPFNVPDLHYYYFARIAVWLAAHSFGLRGKEVLVPAYHHGVEIEALVAAGATPVFYPVGPRWEVCVEDVRRRIGPRTGALYLTHFAGFPGPVAEMRTLADAYGLPLIEDCALSLFSKDGERPLGSTGDAGIFCLYKTLPVPHGGALVFNREHRAQDHSAATPSLITTGGQTLSALLRNLELRGGSWGQAAKRVVRKFGRRAVTASGIERVATGSDHFDPEHVNIGMSSLSKRIVAAQDVSRIVRTRRRNYLLLRDELAGVAEPLLPELPRGTCPLFYPVVVENKERIVRELRGRGIGAVNFWRHSRPACDLRDFPHVARLRATVMEIPCHQDLTPRKIREMAEIVREVIRET